MVDHLELLHNGDILSALWRHVFSFSRMYVDVFIYVVVALAQLRVRV